MDLLKQRHKNVLCLGAKRTSGIVPFWLQLQVLLSFCFFVFLVEV